MALTGFNHQVQWSEFRTVPRRPAGVAEDAQIDTRAQGFQFRTRQRPGEPCRIDGLNAGVVVNRAHSWVVRGRDNAQLLAHEQGHFDITALGVREIYNRMEGLEAEQCPDINRLVSAIQQEVQARVTQADAAYDRETDHGNNAGAQQRWTQRIRQLKTQPSGTLATLLGAPAGGTP